MIPTYKDLVTGKVVKNETSISLFSLVNGNWSCDCNRCIPFEGLDEVLTAEYGDDLCYGSSRIIVIDLEEVDGDFNGADKTDLIKLMNASYSICDHQNL